MTSANMSDVASVQSYRQSLPALSKSYLFIILINQKRWQMPNANCQLRMHCKFATLGRCMSWLWWSLWVVFGQNVYCACSQTAIS